MYVHVRVCAHLMLMYIPVDTATRSSINSVFLLTLSVSGGFRPVREHLPLLARHAPQRHLRRPQQDASRRVLCVDDVDGSERAPASAVGHPVKPVHVTAHRQVSIVPTVVPSKFIDWSVVSTLFRSKLIVSFQSFPTFSASQEQTG